MPNQFEYLAQPIKSDILGSFERGRARQFADQELRGKVDRENRFRQLAPQEYTADTPEKQQAYLTQLAGINPQAAAQASERFGSGDDRRRQMLGEMSTVLTSLPAEQRPTQYQRMVPLLRQLGLEAPDQYTPQVDSTAQQLATLFSSKSGKGAAAGGVQSTLIGNDGQYYTVDRATGAMKPTGVFADQSIQVIEQPGGNPYGVVKSRGRAGEIVPLGGPPSAVPGTPPPESPSISGQSQPLPPGVGPRRIPTAAETASETARAKAAVELETAPEIARQTAAASTTAKTGAERQAVFIDEGLRAADSLPVINRAIELLDSVSTGGLDAAKLAATNFFGVTGADEGELSNNLGKSVLSQLRATFGAAFTEREGARLAELEGGFGKSTAVNKRLLGQAKDIVNRAARRGIDAARAAGDEFTAQEIERSIRMKMGSVQPSSSARQAPSDARSFSSEAEAEAAGIAPGTRVIIGGVPGTWQ